MSTSAPELNVKSAKGLQTAFIIGGASGIGLASAELLAADGWRVVLGDRDERALESAIDGLSSKGYEAHPVLVDVTSTASVTSAFAHVTESFGLDCLVNSAGVLQHGSILDVSDEDWDRMIDISLTGSFRTCRAAVKFMREGGGGTIVNFSSISGRTSSFYSAPNYVAAKAGVIGLTMAIARQHASEGIRANCVAPGLIRTPMTNSAYTSEQRLLMTGATPISRFADAGEVAEAVLFLASARSSYITGQTLNVNGGSFMQ